MAAENRLVFLVEPEPGRFGFEIRSLQEFWAAWALSIGPDDKVKQRIQQIANAPMFRNVLLFLISKFFADASHLRDYIIALPSADALLEISNHLRAASANELDALRQLLRIGIQWQTQVTLNDARQLVSQTYCSALPVAYSGHAPRLWAEFARLVLEASYEATICTAILNAAKTGNNQLFLTLLGGGAFGNDMAWIMSAIQRALTLHKHVDLDVAIVSYGSSNPNVRALVQQM